MFDFLAVKRMKLVAGHRWSHRRKSTEKNDRPTTTCSQMQLLLALCFLLQMLPVTETFTSSWRPVASQPQHRVDGRTTELGMFFRVRGGPVGDGNLDGDEEEEEDDADEAPDPYRQIAESEFLNPTNKGQEERDDPKGSFLARRMDNSTGGAAGPTTNIDWGGALGRLRERMEDVESGKSQDPSQVLFRLMSSETPNQSIGSFVSTASPKVVQAMSGTIGSMLGGLATPTSGFETVVKATGDKVASLCFQLQMTGYLFRNAEYAMALKDLMKLEGSPSLQEYKAAFDRVDTDGSGYIEVSEIKSLMDDVYEGKAPAFEIEAFLQFFDGNADGRISWEEFQRGLIGMVQNTRDDRQEALLNTLSLPGADLDDDDDDEEEDEQNEVEARLSGTIEIEMEDGMVVEMNAQEYMQSLKKEAKALKDALQNEKGGSGSGKSLEGLLSGGSQPEDDGGITGFLASRKGDMKSLTEGMSPEIVKTMQLLVDFVLEGGGTGAAPPEAKNAKKEEIEMSIPGPALQQLALWQLVLGYRLREAEVKGDYLKLLE